jgi:GNAT superfamily N-acetyltransferase
VEHDGLTLVIGLHSSPVVVNSIFRSGVVGDPGAALEFARRTYASIGHGMSLLTSSHADAAIARAAGEAGWQRLFDLVGMILDRPIPAGPELAGAMVFEADPVADLATVRRIEVAGFADTQDEAEMVAGLFADSTLLAQSDTATYLAGTASSAGAGGMLAAGDMRAASRLGAAAAAMVVNVPVGADQVGVIAWVATEPDHRRHGYGGLATQAASNRGFELGAKAVVLQASPMGLPVYRRLGYRALCEYTIWAPPGA